MSEKHADVVISHLKMFVAVFACMIIFLCILRGAILINGRVTLETFSLILLVSAPDGTIEGYGVCLTNKKTHTRAMTMKALACIYGIFA